jgi:hypothetical protein
MLANVGGARASLGYGDIALHSSRSPVPWRYDLSEAAVRARRVIVVRTARSRIGSAKPVHQRQRCCAERGDGRFGWCRFGSRESGPKTPQRTSISQRQLSHLPPYGHRRGFGVSDQPLPARGVSLARSVPCVHPRGHQRAVRACRLARYCRSARIGDWPMDRPASRAPGADQDARAEWGGRGP